MAEEGRKKTSESGGESRYVIDSVMKTLQVLFAFRTQPSEFTISEIEQMVGLSKNQVFRSLKSLEEFGLLRLAPSGHYRVTPLIYQLSSAGEIDSPLEEVAQPIMEQLQKQTGETVNLCCLVEGYSVIISRRHSQHSVRLNVQLGQRSLLHAGANPKAMLAYLSEADQEHVLSMLPYLQKHTDKTVTDPVALRRELQEIRSKGYSISDEDFEIGARGVGAPIFSGNGRVVGGISAGGPVQRVSLEQIPQFGELTMSAARRISRILGYMDEPKMITEKGVVGRHEIGAESF